MHDITPGTRLTIHYPRCRHIQAFDRSPLRPRQITIRQIRDLVADPLTPAEFLRRPYTRRGRWLVRALEHIGTTTQYRQFYLANSPEFFRPGGLRIALYEPAADRPEKIISREFDSTIVDRRAMIRLINRLTQLDHDGLTLRILADDFRIIA